jgi:hypothetical protein
VISGEEPEKRPPAPFYHVSPRTGKPTKEMVGTREVVITLAKASKSMTKYAIEKETGMATASKGLKERVRPRIRMAVKSSTAP